MTQTMTPEERAAALVASIMEHLFVDGETVSVDVMNPASDLIIAAIRDAENAALDRAAAKADRWFNHEMKFAGAFEKHGKTEAAKIRISCSATAALIEGDILDLKSPKPPETA